MPTLLEFLKTGHLGPLSLGLSPFEAETVLGDPQDRSIKKNPLHLKYDALRLTFWKHGTSSRSQLMDIVISFQPPGQRMPKTVELTDLGPDKDVLEEDFIAFLNTSKILHDHVLETPNYKQLYFPSGVTAFITEKRLSHVRLVQRKSREATSLPLTDTREPNALQFQNMLLEARSLLNAGFYRAALIQAWAAFEAALRRAAIKENLQGRIGVQSAILVREMLAAHALSPNDAVFVERARQLRTSIVHGLAPQEFDIEMVTDILDLAERLMSRGANDSAVAK